MAAVLAKQREWNICMVGSDGRALILWAGAAEISSSTRNELTNAIMVVSSLSPLDSQASDSLAPFFLACRTYDTSGPFPLRDPAKVNEVTTALGGGGGKEQVLGC